MERPGFIEWRRRLSEPLRLGPRVARALSSPASARAGLASGIDHAFAWFVLGRNGKARAKDARFLPDHASRIAFLDRMLADVSGPAWTTPPEVFFGEAGAPGPARERAIRRLDFGSARGEVVDLSWRSGYEPLSAAPEVRSRWERGADNLTAHARAWRHDGPPRPTLLLFHGYLAGQYGVEERAWPARWLFAELGLDLAFVVLPFHARRGPGRPPYPGPDPRVNNEALRQAVYDAMTLRRRLTAAGAPHVGALGMSLGGYTTALLATADAGLSFTAPFVPVASFADFAREGRRFVGGPGEQAEQHEKTERAHAPTSPLSRPCLIDPRRVLVTSGRADRITPASHGRRIAEHFGTELRLFEGGHLMQFGRASAFTELAEMLRREGVISAGS